LELVKKYRDTVLEVRGLALPSQVQTLFESCKTEEEARKFVPHMVNMLRGQKIGSSILEKVVITETKKETEVDSFLKHKIKQAFEGMR